MMCRHDLSRIAAAVVLLLSVSCAHAAVAQPMMRQAPRAFWTDLGSAQIEAAPSLDRYIHRLLTRAERSGSRFATFLGSAGAVWLWLALSVIAFVVVIAMASVVDFRMLELRHSGSAALGRYVGDGLRIFLGWLRIDVRHCSRGPF